MAAGRALFRECREGALRMFAAARVPLDYPAAGLVLFALGAWGLLREDGPPQEALRLLAKHPGRTATDDFHKSAEICRADRD